MIFLRDFLVLKDYEIDNYNPRFLKLLLLWFRWWFIFLIVCLEFFPLASIPFFKSVIVVLVVSYCCLTECFIFSLLKSFCKYLSWISNFRFIFWGRILIWLSVFLESIFFNSKSPLPGSKVQEIIESRVQISILIWGVIHSW